MCLGTMSWRFMNEANFCHYDVYDAMLNLLIVKGPLLLMEVKK